MPDEQSPPSDHRTDREAAWVIGWFMIGFGLLIGGYSIGWKLYLAHQKAPEIAISLKWTLGPVFLVLFGAANVLGLNPFGKMFEEGHHITFVDILRLLAIAAIGLAVEWLLKQHFESLGYRFPI